VAEDPEEYFDGGRCGDCGQWPCLCDHGLDFCDICGNPEDECTCDMEDPLDDMEANTQGDIS
jgi:hypothetical protein